ncbi:MAG: hypothetical protein AB7K04_10665 [Pseudorhodoplanes sp.]
MDDRSPAPPFPASSAREAGYESILATLMATARGREFLDEYARRSRNADTAVLLSAIERLEAVVQGKVDGQRPTRPLADALTEIATRAVQLRGLMRAGDDGPPENPGDMLARSAAALRATAEQLGEVVWQLREQQYDDRFSDAIDRSLQDLLQACGQLDATGRIACALADFVVTVESELSAIAAQPPESLEAASTAPAGGDPQSSEEAAKPSGDPAVAGAAEATRVEVTAGTEIPDVTEDDPAGFLLEPASPHGSEIRPPSGHVNRPPDPFASIRALSEEERIALFG